MMATMTKAALLRNTFRGNAAFSFMMAVLMLLTLESTGEWLGIAEADVLGLLDGSTFLVIIAVGTLLFGAFGAWTSAGKPIRRDFAWAIVVSDFAWVIISWVLLLMNALPFTTAGSWAVLIVADIVLLFGIVQIVGIRRMRHEV